MKSIRILVVLAMAAVLTVLRVGTASAAPSTTATPYPPSCPIMSVSTTTPNPGQTITVTGSNFHPSVDLTINLDTNVVLAHVLTSAGGSFST
ncbi:MAG: hypothetical protein QOG80_1886, partial [Pseudonocardiales bacterium]|nr:hypothetical protein [Pseudonocardiales bacterium]